MAASSFFVSTMLVHSRIQFPDHHVPLPRLPGVLHTTRACCPAISSLRHESKSCVWGSSRRPAGRTSGSCGPPRVELLGAAVQLLIPSETRRQSIQGRVEPGEVLLPRATRMTPPSEGYRVFRSWQPPSCKSRRIRSLSDRPKPVDDSTSQDFCRLLVVGSQAVRSLARTLSESPHPR